ncbi:MAG: sugar nucleotide-binding protein [Chloroflexota bacterium]
MTKLLVTGGSSYLGRHLIPLIPDYFETHYTFFNHDRLNLPKGTHLDLRDKTAVLNLIDTIQPNVILHLAGSNRSDDMATIIRDGTSNIVIGARRGSVRLIHLSTDSIFDGLSPPYDESVKPTPVNEYGRVKADAESLVQAHHNNAVIVRTSLIYGLKEMDHGTRWMSRALENNESISLFSNQLRNPIWVEALSKACIELISHDFRGILNIVGNQVLTRAAFAVRMFDYWQIGNRKLVTIKNSSKNNWPLNCQLDNQLAKRILKTPLLGVDEVLSQHSI